MFAVAERKESTILAAQRGQEVVVGRKNDIGILFHVSALLSDNDVNILGISAGVCGEDCLIRLITSDNQQATELLAANGFRCEEKNVILVSLPHQPGMLKQVTKVLAQEGIDIRHVYAAADKDQGNCLLVFHTSNDDVALAKLKDVQADEERQTDRDRNANMVSEGGPV
jgi:hypothetical protein